MAEKVAELRRLWEAYLNDDRYTNMDDYPGLRTALEAVIYDK